MNKLFSSKRSQKGVTLIEYALIASLIAVVSVTIMTSTGTKISSVFTTVCQKLNGGTAC